MKATIRRAFCAGVAVAALVAPRIDLFAFTRFEDGVADLERMLTAEKTLVFETLETTIDVARNGEEFRMTSRVLVADGRRLEKILETNIPAESEGSRGSASAAGPADVETLPVPMFPDGLGDWQRLADNYVFTAIGSDDDAGWRIEPRHHSGMPIEVVLDKSGLWRKIAVYDRAGHVRQLRYRDSTKLLAALDDDRRLEIRKKGRPAVAESGGSHVDEEITADEARRRLPGVFIPSGTVLGFTLDRIESVTDGASGSEVILLTLRDGLLTLVLAQTLPASAQVGIRPDGAGGDESTSPGAGPSAAGGGGDGADRESGIVVQKSVDHSDTGVSVYQWTDENGVASLLVSTIPAADTRRLIEGIVRRAGR